MTRPPTLWCQARQLCGGDVLAHDPAIVDLPEPFDRTVRTVLVGPEVTILLEGGTTLRVHPDRPVGIERPDMRAVREQAFAAGWDAAITAARKPKV